MLLSTTTYIHYDTSNRLIAVSNNPVQTINPRNYATQHQYDALNRLTQTTDADNGTTHFAYDDQDRLTSVTDANGNTTTYDYDAFDNLIKEVSPDTGETRHAYDNAGNRIASVDSRGIVTQYTYDALNRLTAVNYPLYPEENVTYDYDVDTYQDANGQTHTVNAKGRLFRISDESGQTLYAYDHRGNITSQLQIIGKDSNPANNPVYWTDYLYDTGNKLTQMQVFLPDGSLSYATTYQYDSVGRVINISYQTQSGGSTQNLASNLHYVPFGGLTQLTYGNGVHTQLAYDQNYRLSGWLTTSDTSTLLERSYSYDANSNVTQIDHLQNLPESQSFTYDLLDRLSQSDDQTGITDWSYDSVGNRLTENTATETNDYGYQLGSNILADIQNTNATPITTKNYTVDNRGNTTEMTEGTSITTFSYNGANRPSTMTKDGVTTSYVYNALGQRTVKTQGANTTHYVYNLNGQLMGEYQNGQAVVEYTYIANQPLAQLRSGQAYCYHVDHLGTPVVMTDQNQNEVWRADYTAFGKANITTETIENNLRTIGQYYDAESELHYVWHRYLDPELGRFTQSDPTGLFDGPNTYLYAQANPLKYIDPNGLWSFSASAYLGPGGGINIAYSDGTLEITGEVGVGIGAGLTVDPSGGPSPHSQDTGSGYIARTTVDVGAGIGIGPIGAGASFTGATGNAVTTPQGGGYTSGPSANVGASFEDRPRFGFQFGASVNAEIGSYTN